jgi:hypothetical protein
MLLGGSLKFFNFPKSPYLHSKTTPMQDKSPYGDWPGRLIVLAVTAMLIFVQFSDWFQHPNQLTDLWGDAIKNYTAPWYHVKYDSSYAQYQGMHYPFGDHINTVDGQPILSNSLKAVTHYAPGAGEYFPALSNLSMLLSFLIGSFFMYLLYRAFGLPVWLSVVLSVFVTFLSPQTLRVVSHFGLAHIAAIPVCLYLLYRFWKEPTWGKSLLIAGAVTFYSLFHLYFLAILGGLIGGMHLVQCLQKVSVQSTLTFCKRMGTQLVLPAALLLAWTELTDVIQDRNAFPYGFFAYRAYLEGIFTSHMMPYFQWFEHYLIDIRDMGFEAWNYVGLVIGGMFFLLLAGLIRHLFKALPLIPETLPGRDFLTTLFIASLLNLVFALGLPFIIPGLEGLLDYTGPLRQFRGIGRFAWNCFYSWHLIGWVALFYWVKGHFVRRRMLGLAALALTAFEAFTVAKYADVELKAPLLLHNGQSLTELQIDYNEFQAVQTVPHYNIGSGNFWWVAEGFIIHFSTMLGIQTGLPTTSSQLTRTSPDQALQQLQLATPPYRMPRILEAFPDERPLLLMWDKQQAPLSKQSYDHFLEDTELLFEGERMKLMRLPLSSFASRLEREQARVRAAFAIDSTLFQHSAFRSTDSLLNFAYQALDQGPSEAAYLGTGGLSQKYPEFTEIWNTKLPGMAPEGQYICSFWVYVQPPVTARAEIVLYEVNPSDGSHLHQTYTQVHQSIQLVDTNGWVLVEFPFTRQSADSRFSLQLKNRDLRQTELLVDELLIRPAATDLYRRLDGGLWVNNRWWPGL